MTKFVKANFVKSGAYLTYEGQFVARFKYSNSPVKPGAFKKFLVDNFTVEEYFEALKSDAPFCILEKKGFTW